MTWLNPTVEDRAKPGAPFIKLHWHSVSGLARDENRTRFYVEKLTGSARTP